MIQIYYILFGVGTVFKAHGWNKHGPNSIYKAFFSIPDHIDLTRLLSDNNLS